MRLLLPFLPLLLAAGEAFPPPFPLDAQPAVAADIAPLYAAAPRSALVDPRWGVTLGNNKLGPTRPFGLAYPAPDPSPGDRLTEDQGYMRWLDPKVREKPRGYRIHRFSMTHLGSTGGFCYLSPRCMVQGGEVVIDHEKWLESVREDQHASRVGYYRADLPRAGATVELAATDRCVLMRITPAADKPTHLLIPLLHRGSRIAVSDGAVTGVSVLGTFGNTRIPVHFRVEASRPWSSTGTWNVPAPAPADPRTKVTRIATPGGTEVATHYDQQNSAGLWLTWPADAARTPIVLRWGLSFTDGEGAALNLKRELDHWDFPRVVRETLAAWERALGVVDWQGLPSATAPMFHAALMRSFQFPHRFEDADGRVLGFDKKVRRVEPPRAVPATYSGWDTYRTQMPLLALLRPDWYRDCADAIVAIKRETGGLPNWPCGNVASNCMQGRPLEVMLATAFGFAVPAFDRAGAYAAMQGIRHGRALGGSGPLEITIAFAGLAWSAEAMGDAATATRARTQAARWRELYGEIPGHDGPWLLPQAPGQLVPAGTTPDSTTHCAEGSLRQFMWMVPHDPEGLAELLGGRERAAERLAAHCAAKWHCALNNEPSLGAPWMMNRFDPARTGTAVWTAIGNWFNATPYLGLPLHDDLGTMSAYLVWAACGLYPLHPASGELEIGVPAAERMVLTPMGGAAVTITCTGRPATGYARVATARWNGAVLPHPRIAVSALRAGGTLELELAAATR